MQPFDRKIQSVIRKFWYPVWFVIRDPNIKCACVDFTTGQPDQSCRKCLGTGRKIHIVRVRAAHQNDDLSMRGEGLGYAEKNVTANFYTLNDVNANADDIIVDGNELFIIQWSYPERSNASRPVYYKHVASPKKNSVDTFLRNFREVLANAGYGQQ